MPERSDPAELLEMVTTLITEYSERDLMLDELEDFYFLQNEQDPEKKEERELERVQLPHGTNAVDLVQDLCAGAGLQVTVPAFGEKPKQKEIADLAEEFLRSALMESERAQHIKMLNRSAWLVAMRGCLAGRVVARDDWMDKEDQGELPPTWAIARRLPIQIQLRDPRYVYPSLGTDGLAFLAEQWDRTVQDIRNSYGDEMLPGKKLTQEVTWTEYWDSHQYCYWADKQVVSRGESGLGPWFHGYGGIPYAFAFARQTGKEEPEKRVRPLLEGIKSTIRWLNTLDSMTMTSISRYNGDTLNVYSDEMSTPGAKRVVTLKSGGINYLRAEEKMEWLRASRQPVEVAILRGEMQAMLERGTFPGTLYGQDPGRVMAGYAINMLNQSGQTRILPLLECIEQFFESLLSNALMLAAEHTAPLVKGPITFYSYTDAEEEEGGRRRIRAESLFDPQKLDGHYHVEVQIGEILPADQQANVVLAQRSREPGVDGRPLLSDETILEKFKLGDSAADERMRIDRQMAWSDPAVAALRQKLYAVQAVRELKKDLLKLDVTEEEIQQIIREASEPQRQEQAPPAMPAMPPEHQMVPPGIMPPQMQGGGAEMPIDGLPPELDGMSPEMIQTYLEQMQQLPQMPIQGPGLTGY